MNTRQKADLDIFPDCLQSAVLHLCDLCLEKWFTDREEKEAAPAPAARFTAPR